MLNVCGGIMTTNHKTGGIYLPADDRRHYVAWSLVKATDFPEGHWIEFWKWYEDGGFGHVAAYLQTLDISDFDPKAPPPRTTAFWAIVDANRSTEDAELSDFSTAWKPARGHPRMRHREGERPSHVFSSRSG